MKEKMYKKMVGPLMLYDLETVALRKIQEAEWEVKMFRLSLGVMRMDRFKNEYIRGILHVLERKAERPD